MVGMGYDASKRQAIQALHERRFRHERRSGENKNLLETGEVTIEEAIQLLGQTRGTEATSSPHHFDRSVDVWVLRPRGWYIKFYVMDLCWFISFHQSEERL